MLCPNRLTQIDRVGTTAFSDFEARRVTPVPRRYRTQPSNPRHRPTGDTVAAAAFKHSSIQAFKRSRGSRGSRTEPVPPVSHQTLECWNAVGAARRTERRLGANDSAARRHLSRSARQLRFPNQHVIAKKLRQIYRRRTADFSDCEAPALTQPRPWIRFAGEG
jgi:hypothetical protein